MGDPLKLTVLHLNHGMRDFQAASNSDVSAFQINVAEWLGCQRRQLILMYHGQVLGEEGSIGGSMSSNSGLRLTAIIDEEEEVASVVLPVVPPRPVAPIKTWVKSYKDKEDAKKAAENYKKNHGNSPFGDFGFGGLHDFGMRGMDMFGMGGLGGIMGAMGGLGGVMGGQGGMGGFGGMMSNMMGGIGGMMGGLPGAKPGAARPSAAKPGPASNRSFLNSLKPGSMTQPQRPSPASPSMPADPEARFAQLRSAVQANPALYDSIHKELMTKPELREAEQHQPGIIRQLLMPPSAAPVQVSKEAEEAAIRHLMEMGVDEAQARQAYITSGKRLEIAVDRLFQ